MTQLPPEKKPETPGIPEREPELPHKPEKPGPDVIGPPVPPSRPDIHVPEIPHPPPVGPDVR